MAHALHLPHVSRRGPLLGFIILMHAVVIYYINAGLVFEILIPKPDLSWVNIAPEPVKPKPEEVVTAQNKTQKRVVIAPPKEPPRVAIDEPIDPIAVTDKPTDPILDTTESVGVHRVYPAADPRHPIDKPAYPPQAIRMNQEGLVVVNACVQPNGRLANLSVSRTSGFAVLDAAAVRHLARPGIRMLPGTENGRPATLCINLPIRFVIENR